jgi:hypothetical protein
VHTLHVFGSVYRLLALFRVEVHRERQLDDDARYLEGGDTRYAETETQRESATATQSYTEIVTVG